MFMANYGEYILQMTKVQYNFFHRGIDFMKIRESSRKILHILLAVVLIINLSIVGGSVYAEPKSEAEVCEILDVLKGDGKGLTEEYLSKPTERLQAIILTLRLAGNNYEKIALKYEGEDNFTDADVVSWDEGRNILAYIKDNPQFGWRGNTDGSFNPQGKVTAQMFYKVLLEALGYKQDYGEGGDFKWTEVMDFAFNVGLWDLMGLEELNNADIAVGIVEALQLPIKDSDMTLLEKLVDDGSIEESKAIATGLLSEIIDIPEIVSLKEIDLGTVYDGEEVLLPNVVQATYSDGTVEDAPVEWHFDYENLTEGENTITGDVEGTEITAFATVNIVTRSLEVVSVGADNLIEIHVKFNKSVDIDRALNFNNYIVTSKEDKLKISKISLSSDRKTVTLLMDVPLKPQQSVDVSVKKEIGIKRNHDSTIDYVIDKYEPEVVSVKALGNKIIRVSFSEPVKYATHSSNYTLDGKIIGTSGLKMPNASTVDINMTKRLENGTYKLGIRSGIVDYAGFKVLTDPIEFTVEEDSTELDIEEIISVTQTMLKLRFTKPVEPIIKDQILAKQGGKVAVVEYEENMKTYTIEFERTAALRPEGTEINFFNITDLYGNKKTLKTTVVPTIDTEIPEYVDYEIKDQDKIILEFSKDVLPTGATYVLKNSDGNTISLAQTGWYKDGAGRVYRKKIELQRPGGLVFDPDYYVLTIQDVVDYTPQENRIIPITIEFTVIDNISPEVKSVRVKDRQLFINFSESLDPNTATSRNSYRYLSFKTYASNIFPEETIYELIAGDRTVVITLPEDFDMKVIDVLQISAVTDLTGNEMEAEGIVAPFGTIDSSPKVISAAVTGKNTIVLNLNKEIDASTLSIYDFIVTAGDNVLDIYETDYEEETRKVTLYIQELISSNGQYAGRDIYVETASDEPNTKDVYGQPIQATTKPIKAVDKYAPYATGFITMYNGENTDIIISLNENIRTSYGTGKPLANNNSELGQFIVLANNVVSPVISSKYEEATSTGTARIILTIKENQVDKKIRVMFFAGPNNTLTDYAPTGNPLANFELP